MPVLRTVAGGDARARHARRGVRATRDRRRRASGGGSAATSARRGERGGAGNVGMMRLLDLHAVSCAGDTLITIGLAGTIFFSVPAGEARGRVALYLLVTMVPFALLAPVVGPLLDRFRHGRRYALAATMLGRARPGLGHRRPPAASGCTRPRSACWRCPGPTAWPAAPPCPGCCRPGSACPRRAPGPRSSARWPARSWPRSACGRVLDRPTVAAAGGRRHLRGRHGGRAAPAAQGRLRPARGASRRSSSCLAAPHDSGKVLSGRLVLAVLAGSAALRGAVRVPAAVPGVRDPRGRPDDRRCSASTLSAAAALGVVGGALGARHVPVHRDRRRLRIRRPDPVAGGRLRRGRAWPAAYAALRFSLGAVVAAVPGHGDRQRSGQARGRRLDPGTDPRAGAGQRVRPRRDAADAGLGGRRRGRA